MVAHNVVRINGSLPGGEVWSVTPKFNRPSGPVTEYEDLERWAGVVAGTMEAWESSNIFRQLLSSAGTIDSVRVEARNAANQLTQAAEVQLTPSLAGFGSANKIFQSCVVFTFLTGRPGRSYKGRMYWPALNASLNSTLRLSQANIDSYASNGVQLLEMIGGAGATEGEFPIPVVVSQTTGASTPITSVRVGDILDIQRRRRDSLTENYGEAAIGIEP